MKNPLLTLAGLSLLLAAGPAFATAIDASLAVKATAIVYDPTTQGRPPVVDTHSDTDAWAGTPAALGASTAATASAPGFGTAHSFSDAAATFAADGNSGTVTLDYGWTSADAGYAWGMDVVSTPTWLYHFTADASGMFVMNFAYTPAGDQFGLRNLRFKLSGETEGGIDAFSPLSGTYSRAVLAGQDYTVTITEGANIGGADGPREGSAHVVFDWSLPGAAHSVPDAGPTTAWFVLGTTLLFVTLKGRKKAAVVRSYHQPANEFIPVPVPVRETKKRRKDA
ncbi:MAG TPA: hypothetical protein VG734_13905 [Lacunisphaera sp.]|nr:hypothetical protein [Lacunisphaera sp.]